MKLLKLCNITIPSWFKKTNIHNGQYLQKSIRSDIATWTASWGERGCSWPLFGQCTCAARHTFKSDENNSKKGKLSEMSQTLLQVLQGWCVSYILERKLGSVFFFFFPQWVIWWFLILLEWWECVTRGHNSLNSIQSRTTRTWDNLQ